MSTTECFHYSIQQTEEGVRLYTEELFAGGQIVDSIIQEPVLEQLEKVAEKYRLDLWDGFDKRNRQIQDGSSFSLSMTLADGWHISAKGSNRFPDRYANAKGEICAIFEELMKQYENRSVRPVE